jgi:hypothetical protein
MKRCENCKSFCKTKHYENFKLVGHGIGCRLADEWWAKGLCDKYELSWYKYTIDWMKNKFKK